MSRKQKVCLWAGTVVIVLMNLFPPCIAFQRIPEGDYPTITLRKYAFIFKVPYILYNVSKGPVSKVPPVSNRDDKYSDWLAVEKVDITRLIIQCFIVALLTAGSIITFKEKEDKKPKDDQKQ